jgi:ice-binding like protein
MPSKTRNRKEAIVIYSQHSSSRFCFVVPILAMVLGACGGGGSADIGSGSSGSDSSGGSGGGSSGSGSSGSSVSSGSSGTSVSSGSSGTSVSSGSSGSSGGAEDGGTTDGGNTSSTLPVNLRTAGNYVILAKSGISTVPTSAVTGNIGVSPAAATLITGFSLIADSTNVFSTSPQITGKAYAADYAAPTPSNLTTAIGDMLLAFTDAAGRAPTVTELGAGNIGGKTLSPGVYKWGTGLLIPTNVILTGSATDVWILQIAKNLTMSNATGISLTGGAVAKNVFWQVAGLVDLGTTAHFEGVILTQTSINMQTGASINGRLMAQTAVTIASSTVVQPAP